MKSVKLTKSMRAGICANVQAEFVKNKAAKYESVTLNDLSMVIRSEDLKAGVKLWCLEYAEYISDIRKIPVPLLSGCRTFKVMVADTDLVRDLPLPLKMHYPCVRGRAYLIAQGQWDKHVAPVVAIAAYTQQVRTELNELVAEVKPILDSVNTTKQLIELWPNAEGYLPAYIADPQSINVPALSISNLERKIGGNT